jgi:predicted TIM-barrel fold metal-dependent hydrolase
MEQINRDAWRSLVREDAIDPGLPIIDAHHHIWPVAPDPAFECYDVPALLQDVSASAHDIVGTVFIEAHARYRPDGPEHLKPVGETAFADSVAEQATAQGGRASGLCAGIVAFADLRLGDAVEEVLAAHRAASPRLRGIRQMVASDPDMPATFRMPPGVLASPDFRAGFARLARHGLSFDAFVVHPQLGDVLDLARAFPETIIILDHLGGPMGIGRFADGGEDRFAAWRGGLAALAACDNVVVKLGGLYMRTTGLAAPLEPRPRTSSEMAAAQRDHILTAIDLFGPHRTLFESNFPVDRSTVSYDVLWNAFKRITGDFTPDERSAMFAGTAKRAYRLDAIAISG